MSEIPHRDLDEGTFGLKTHGHSESVDDGRVFEERHRYGCTEFFVEPVMRAARVRPIVTTIALEILVQGDATEESRPVGERSFDSDTERVDTGVVLVGNAVDFGRL